MRLLALILFILGTCLTVTIFFAWGFDEGYRTANLTFVQDTVYLPRVYEFEAFRTKCYMTPRERVAP